jgi:uncharacterized protein YdeI (YjbR/CyaY-like superfamily)
MTIDPRVDGYIAKQQPFARPILEHLRTRVHAACPEATETIKWGMPFFELEGRPLANMAGFKAHASFGFWRRDGNAPLTGQEGEAMGQFGRLTTLDDLPGDAALDAMIRAAAARAATSTAPKPRAAPKPEAAMPDDLATALAVEPDALAGFEALPPGARRDYVLWVGEAKRDATRHKRIATTVAQCAEGKKLHWKYES